MIYTYEIEGLTLQTGDIICTMNGKPDILPGEFWRFVGRLVPGDVDHVAIYLGPSGRCVEAGARGVNKFTVFDGQWNTERMARLTHCLRSPPSEMPSAPASLDTARAEIMSQSCCRVRTCRIS